MFATDPYATLSNFQKDPAAVLDFAVDWAGWLADGDSIDTATWTVPAGISQPVTPTPTVVGAKATVWLTGGTVGESYPVVCQVQTVQGRVDERTITVRVVQR